MDRKARLRIAESYYPGYMELSDTIDEIMVTAITRGTGLVGRAKAAIQAITAYEKFVKGLPMNRTMYDSTDPTKIPPGAQIVAFYPHAWSTDMASHQHALQVRIDNRGDHADDCHMLDVESGAATLEVAAEWVASWHKLHPNGMTAINGFFHKPTLYVSLDAWDGLKSAVNNQQVDYVVAHWDGQPTAIDGAVGKQYEDGDALHTAYDLSIITDATWGVSEVVGNLPTNPTHATMHPGPNAIYGTVQWGGASGTENHARVASDDSGWTWSQYS